VVKEKLLENIERFSKVCSKKGKHLSLSFTLQKDNWEQLPLVLNHCNDVDAYIYVSYLERPIHFAITDMSKEQLIEMRDYYEKFSFPLFTQKERHNRKCFDDVKNYLDTYIKNTEETKYHQYRFDNSDLFKDENASAPKHSIQLPAIISNEEWLTWVDSSYQKQSSYSSLLPKELFLRNIAEVMKSFEKEDELLIKSTMIGTSFDQILESVKHFSIDELIKLSTSQLNKLKAGIL
jgi:hypothetical protein